MTDQPMKAAISHIRCMADPNGGQTQKHLHTILTALDQAAEALKPFGREAESWPETYLSGDAYIATAIDGTVYEAHFSMGDLLRAATVYATLKPVDTKEGEGT